MSTFRDGPAKGAALMLRRAPVYLRVVVDADGNVDAIDQLEDEARLDETIHVYRVVEGTWGRGHVCIRGRDRDAGGWYEFAEYEHVADVHGEQFRDGAAWREWATGRLGVTS